MQWYLWWVVWLEQTEKSNLKQPQPQTPVAELLMFDCIPQPTITLTLWFIINNLQTLQTILDAWRRIFLSGNINISLILPLLLWLWGVVRGEERERERGEPVWVVSCGGDETLICGVVAMVTTTLSVRHWT